MANSLDPDQTAPLGAVWSGPTLFAQDQSVRTLRDEQSDLALHCLPKTNLSKNLGPVEQMRTINLW